MNVRMLRILNMVDLGRSWLIYACMYDIVICDMVDLGRSWLIYACMYAICDMVDLGRSWPL